MPDNNPWDDLKRAISGSISTNIKEFLEANSDAREFVQERSARLAKLAYSYLHAASDVEKSQIEESMVIVKATIMTEVMTVAIHASREAKNIFEKVLETAINSLIRMLPAIASVL